MPLTGASGLVASGTGKADIVSAALEGPLSASCPAVLQWHPDVAVVIDEACASRLRNRDYYDVAASGVA